MRLEGRPETFLERIGVWLGMAPEPLLHTQIAYLTARAILTASHIGVFDALVDGPRTRAEIARNCGAQADALRSVLGVLTSVSLVRYRGGAGGPRRDGTVRPGQGRREGAFALTQQSRRWLTSASPDSLHDQMEFLGIIWDWMAKLDDFVRTGEPLDYHSNLPAEQWKIYQRAMRAVAKISASEIGRRTPVPRGAREMLDIGGSHGLYSVELCRRHAGLRSTILDLPEAIPEAEKLMALEGLGGRVGYEEGDALTADLGEGRYDLIFIASLVHHFSDAENRDLCRRSLRALRPGGFLVIQDFVRPAKPTRGNQVGQALDLLFALTSRSGTWSIEEMEDWQHEAGFQRHRIIKLRTLGSFAQVVGRKR